MSDLGKMLSVRIGKMPAPLLKVYKTKHLRRRRDSRGGRPSCHFGSHRLEKYVPKEKSFELKASRAASPVVEQRQAAQYERFGQMLSVRIGKMPAPLLNVYKTKHLRRGPVSGRSEQIAAEAVQDAILGHTDSKNRCQSVVMTTRNC